MNSEKKYPEKKEARSDGNQHSRTSQDMKDKKKDVDAIRHPEEQNVDQKEYVQKGKKNLNDSFKNQRV